jgi:hypothetical protein
MQIELAKKEKKFDEISNTHSKNVKALTKSLQNSISRYIEERNEFKRRTSIDLKV